MYCILYSIYILLIKMEKFIVKN